MNRRGIFLAALLLASAFPAQAQLHVAAPSAEAGALGAAAAAPRGYSTPLSYVPMIIAPSPVLSAGSAFLADKSAQDWFADHHPEILPALVSGAYGLKDWEHVLISYDDPRQLREAMLSRPDSDVATKPAVFLKFVDRNPALAAHRDFYEAAALDWSVFTPEEKAAFAADGSPEGSDKLIWVLKGLVDT